jgi:glycerophosphoryl diester phosphodiesterase
MTGFDANTMPTIVGQSLEDVAIAHRLGFKCIEANVHKTADGNYVVTHGSGGNLGYGFEDLNGNLVNNVAISSKTLSDLQSNYRYRSIYPQFRTSIPSLEEFLRECKKQGMSVYVSYYDDAEMNLVRRVMGGHNFIQSFGTRKDGSYTAAYSDWDTLKNKISDSDSNYMPMMDNDLVAELLADGTLKDKIDEIHSLGRVVGYPASYATEKVNQQVMDAGMDFSVVAYQVNDFTDGNIFSISADNGDFADFMHEGSVREGVLYFTNGGEFKKDAERSYFLAKASLHLKFVGTMRIKLGQYIDAEFTSDGKKEMVFTTFFLDCIPQMMAKSVGSSQIISATYNLSRC